jgi:ketosteroid isomerase-like protein
MTELPWIGRRGRRRRPLEDQLALRYPRLATWINAQLTRLAFKLPPGGLQQRLFELQTWRIYNALARGDIDLGRTINHKDVVWDLRGWAWPEDPFYYGRDGVARYSELWFSAFSEFDFDVVSVEKLHPDVILIHIHLRGIGRTSGVEVERDDYAVLRFKDGLIWRGAYYVDRETAAGAAEEFSAP